MTIGIGYCIPNRKPGIDWSSYWTTSNLVIEGHSFVQTTSYLTTIIAELLNTTAIYRVGTGGATVTTIEGRAETIDGYLVAESSTNKNILALCIGTNDVTNTEGTGTSTYVAVKSYVQDRIAAGWKVFIFTITPSTVSGKDARFEAERNVYNGLLKSDLALLKSAYVIDTDTQPLLDDTTDTLYYSDTVHPTWLGAFYMGEVLKDYIIALPAALALATLVDVPMTLTLTSIGNGSGVSTMTMASNEDVLVTLDGTARFYTDAAGTLGESTTWIITPSDYRTIYIKCPSGSSTMTFNKNKIRIWSNWTSGTDAASLSGDIGQFVYATYLLIMGANTLSGSITGLSNSITTLRIGGSNTVGGSIDDKTALTTLGCSGSNTIGGSLTNKTSLTYLVMEGANQLEGDIGVNSVGNGLTDCYLNPCRISTYTGGATWTNTRIVIAPSAGYGLDKNEISNILIDTNSSASGPAIKAITIGGVNANMGDTNQGGIWGDFSGEAAPSNLAIAYKNLIRAKGNTIYLNGITVPSASGDGTGFPAGFGNWYRS